jgi:hypothetical protein
VTHPVIKAFEDGLLTPIENVVGQTNFGMRQWSDSYRQFAKLGGQSLQLHKDKLGRQDHTVSWEFRNWIWIREKWTVLVSKRGVEFSISPDTPVEEAWSLWREYLRALGL